MHSNTSTYLEENISRTNENLHWLTVVTIDPNEIRIFREDFLRASDTNYRFISNKSLKFLENRSSMLHVYQCIWNLCKLISNVVKCLSTILNTLFKISVKTHKRKKESIYNSYNSKIFDKKFQSLIHVFFFFWIGVKISKNFVEDKRWI